MEKSVVSQWAEDWLTPSSLPLNQSQRQISSWAVRMRMSGVAQRALTCCLFRRRALKDCLGRTWLCCSVEDWCYSRPRCSHSCFSKQSLDLVEIRGKVNSVLWAAVLVFHQIRRACSWNWRQLASAVASLTGQLWQVCPYLEWKDCFH